MYKHLFKILLSICLHIPRNGIVGLCDNSIFNFSRNLHPIFYRGCITNNCYFLSFLFLFLNSFFFSLSLFLKIVTILMCVGLNSLTLEVQDKLMSSLLRIVLGNRWENWSWIKRFWHNMKEVNSGYNIERGDWEKPVNCHSPLTTGYSLQLGIVAHLQVTWAETQVGGLGLQQEGCHQMMLTDEIVCTLSFKFVVVNC